MATRKSYGQPLTESSTTTKRGRGSRITEQPLVKDLPIIYDRNKLPSNVKKLIDNESNRSIRGFYEKQIQEQLKSGVMVEFITLNEVVKQEPQLPRGYKLNDKGEMVLTQESIIKKQILDLKQAEIAPVFTDPRSTLETTKGNWWHRFGAVWGYPTKSFKNWEPHEQDTFIRYVTDHNIRFGNNWDQFDSTIKEVVEFDDEVARGQFRDLLAGLIVPKQPNHNYAWFGLNYNPWSIRKESYELRQSYIAILIKYWPRYNFYVVKIQREVLETYWAERTTQEDKIRLIKTLVIAASVVLSAITAGVGAGLGAGVLAGIGTGASIAAKELLGVDIDSKDITKGLEDIGKNIGDIGGAIGDAISDINLDPNELLEKIKDIGSNINLDPNELMKKVKSLGLNLDPRQISLGLSGVDLSQFTNALGNIDYDSLSKFLGEVATVDTPNVKITPTENKQAIIDKNNTVKGVTIGGGILAFLAAAIFLK